MQEEYLKLKQANCKNCYRCIRHCPVKAISFMDHQASIMDDECVLCGRCVVACPQNAKEVRKNVAGVRELIASGLPVYASIAPSFAAMYADITIESMESALHSLGFAGVEETAIGATLVKNHYDTLVAEGAQSVIISSCCHSVTMLLQKHFPEALPYLAPVVSPMQVHCLDIKKRLPNAKTVFIGPCISKKAEADEFPGSVDCVLTFEELSEWMGEVGVVFAPSSPQRGGGKTRLFPVAGGILRTMACNSPSYAYLSVDGMENCIQAVRDILNGGLANCFIEMSACTGSCIGGPAMGEARCTPVRDGIAISRYAGQEDFTVDAATEQELYKSYVAAPRRDVCVAESAIREVLRKTGKTRQEDELNCGTCGYETCWEKAEAVVLGKADISMCLPFLKEKAESFSDTIINNTPNGIIVLNESLLVQQINQAACHILNVNDPHDLLGSKVVRVLDPDIFLEVMENKAAVYDRHTYLAEYGRYVRQSVLYDSNYHVLILIMRNVTEEETAKAHNNAIRRKSAEISDHVIEKQMRVVQEIASLLGETAAETTIALTRLKESLDLD